MAELPVKQMLPAVQPFAYIYFILDWMSRAGGKIYARSCD